MATQLIPYATKAELAAAVTAVNTARVSVPLTDASGKPVSAAHPLLRRNPAFATTLVSVVEFAGKDGGLLVVDSADTAVLNALGADAAKAVAAPAKPTADTQFTSTISALKAAIPTVTKAQTVVVGKVP